ncbi:hypothetical protein VTO58DRAFT_110928 [Aureobasidium pullulans]
MSSQKHIAVIGAGVTGLTSALLLAQTGHKVTVLASHYPGDLDTFYASPWAGAHWRTFATAKDTQESDWDMQTYHWWMDIMNEERVRPSLCKSSLKMQDSYGFYDAEPNEPEWWIGGVQRFRYLSLNAEPIASINAKTPQGDPMIATKHLPWVYHSSAPLSPARKASPTSSPLHKSFSKPPAVRTPISL